jgi:5-methyltetrahydrofolate--homocysteine methyltransferase
MTSNTRAYVQQDLAGLFAGEVRYARDAFEGLRLMDAFTAVKRGVAEAQLPALRERRVQTDGLRQAAVVRSRISDATAEPQPERIGVALSGEYQLAPEQSTDALIAHHPEAKYVST